MSNNTKAFSIDNIQRHRQQNIFIKVANLNTTENNNINLICIAFRTTLFKNNLFNSLPSGKKYINK